MQRDLVVVILYDSKENSLLAAIFPLNQTQAQCQLEGHGLNTRPVELSISKLTE